MSRNGRYGLFFQHLAMDDKMFVAVLMAYYCRMPSELN